MTDNPFEPNAVGIRVDDILVDEETGEVLEWPNGIGPDDQLEWLQAQHRAALDEETAWRQAKGAYARAIGRKLRDMGLSRYSSDEYRSRWNSGRQTRRCTDERAREALEERVITQEQLDALREHAVKEYDLEKLEELVRGGVLNEFQAAYLTVISYANGYVVTERVKKRAPEVAREPVLRD